MAIRDHITRVPKMRVKIHMVDVPNSVIDVIGHDGAARRLNIATLSSAFRWPIEGEEWMIEEQNGQWTLGERVMSAAPDDMVMDPAQLQPGDVAVDLGFTRRIVTANFKVQAPAGVRDTTITHTIPRKYSEVIGDGTTTNFMVTHRLNTRAVVISVAENIEDGQLVNLDVVTGVATDYITLAFMAAPTANEFIVTVIG